MLPCSNYTEGDDKLFYEGQWRPLCHEIGRPQLLGDDNLAIELWALLMDDRTPGMGPSTIRTEAILATCEAYGVGWKIFLKIKAVERTYFGIICSEKKPSK